MKVDWRWNGWVYRGGASKRGISFDFNSKYKTHTQFYLSGETQMQRKPLNQQERWANGNQPSILLQTRVVARRKCRSVCGLFPKIGSSEVQRIQNRFFNVVFPQAKTVDLGSGLDWNGSWSFRLSVYMQMQVQRCTSP